MQTSNPLLYSPYERIHNAAPVLKIKLLPIKKLLRFTTLKIKREFSINQYLTVYTSLFAAVGILVAICLAVVQYNLDL